MPHSVLCNNKSAETGPPCSSSSSKFSRTKVVTVVMMPTKRFVHESVTKAELGISKAKDDGYISGMDENLRKTCQIQSRTEFQPP